jgi:hypothetical protein
VNNSRPGLLKGLIENKRNKSASLPPKTDQHKKPKPLARNIAALFNHVDNAESEANAHKFMQLVLHGRSPSAYAMLLDTPDLYFTRIPSITDYSGRTFTDITAAEYYFWSNDFGSLTMMLEAIPKGHDRDDERDICILSELKKQIEKVGKKGISYQQNGQRFHEFNYSDQAHIDVLRHYHKNHSLMNEDQRMEYWITKVGAVQRNVHVCIALQLCRINDNSKNLLGIEQATTVSTKTEWFPLNEDLGTKFAITRISDERGTTACEAPSPNVVSSTLAIVELAEESRTYYREKFKETLRTAHDSLRQAFLSQALPK